MTIDMNKVYPISEIFVSPQGEGVHTGTLMIFIRLAGCNVGKPFPASHYKGYDGLAVNQLPIYTEQCTTWDGRTFACDTDYRVKERLSVQDTFKKLKDMPGNIEHVCITGGEPFIHDLEPLVRALDDCMLLPHIETSGTKEIPDWLMELKSQSEPGAPDRVWLTVSPKRGVLTDTLAKCDEVKLLVDEDFKFDAAFQEVIQYTRFDCGECEIYIQPINGEWNVNLENLKRCLELQKEHPFLRLSTQMHKVWSVR